MKAKYIKPEYYIVEEMIFMFAIFKKLGHICRQCSSCHGCR